MRGNVYWLKFMLDGNMVYQSLDTTSKKEAAHKQAEIMAPLLASEKADALAVMVNHLDSAKVEAARLQDEACPPLSLAQAWEAYVDAENRPQSGERTLADYAGHWLAFTKWMKLNHTAVEYLRDVSSDMAAGFIRHLGKMGRSGNRQNKYLQFLQTFFRVLAKPGKIGTNPFQDIARRGQIPVSKRSLTVEELKRIIETAEGEYKTLFMVGTFTGLRLGDAATLQWGEVDIHRAIIRRIPHKTARTGKAVIIGIPAILGAYLGSLERLGPAVLPTIARRYEAYPHGLCRDIQAHIESCGIPTLKPGTGGETGKRAVVQVGFHSLRHSFISMHAQAGTPQAVMQKLAGHGNPIMTEHYTHIDEGTARSAAAALPVIIGEATPALPAHPMVEAEKVKALAMRLTAKNARAIKKELLAIVG